MFTTLNQLLDIDYKSMPKGKFFLISESYNDGSFLIHHFLSFYLKGGHSVCFVGLAQSFTHYSSVAQKLGVNLGGHLQSGKLIFIEGLKYAVQSMKHERKESTLESQKNPFTGLANRNPKFSLKQFYETIRNEVFKFENDQPFLLLIDDISLFLTLGISSTDVQDFIQYCLVTLCDPKKAGCLVSLAHADQDQGDSDEEILEKYLVYKCNTQLHVKGLSTGYCKEVHGQLEIIDHEVATRTGRPSAKIVQYKITDKNVTFFAPGNSASVL